MFLGCFNVLVLKINFLKIILMCFQMKNILKNNHYHFLKILLF